MDQITRAADPPASAAPPSPAAEFESFVRDTEPRLRRALVAAYGFEDGRDAAAEALGFAWEHWDRVRGMANAAGYLFRVAQSRRRRRKQPVLSGTALFGTAGWTEHRFEPGLPAALATLSERQRLAVVLVHGYGYTQREVAELTGIRPTSVQNHVQRGLARLRDHLGVDHDAS